MYKIQSANAFLNSLDKVDALNEWLQQMVEEDKMGILAAVNASVRPPGADYEVVDVSFISAVPPLGIEDSRDVYRSIYGSYKISCGFTMRYMSRARNHIVDHAYEENLEKIPDLEERVFRRMQAAYNERYGHDAQAH